MCLFTFAVVPKTLGKKKNLVLGLGQGRPKMSFECLLVPGKTDVLREYWKGDRRTQEPA